MKFEDDTIYEDVAKKDYVRVIDEDNVAEGGNHVEKLDVTTAKVTGTRNGEAKVDGNWYKLAYNNNGTAVTVDTNTTYDLVIIGNIIVYADEAEGSIKNVAFVSDTKSTFETVVGDSNVTLKARMYFPDGTDAEVKISKIAGTKLKDTDSAATVQSNLKEKLVTYSKLSDGTYDVKLVSDSNLAGTDDYVAEGEKSAVSNSVNGAYYDSKIYGMSVNEDAVVYVKTKNETKILSGKQVKDWDKTVDNLLTFKSDMLVEESNGIDYVKVATLVTTGAADVPGAKDLSYAYAVVDEYTDTVDGEDKIAVDVWNGTETITLHADAASFDVSLKAGDLFSYKTNGNYIEDVSKGYFSASVLGFDGKVEGEMKVQDASDNSINTYTLSEDVVVLTVDDANTKGVDGASLDSIVEAGYNAAGTARIPNIMFMLGTGDDKDKVVAIVIDSENNELD